MSTAVTHQLDPDNDVKTVLAEYYATVFGWPITIDAESGEVRLRVGEVVDALIMRAGFAAEVNHILVQRMMRAPIIVVAGQPPDWVFLTRPRTALRRATWADLVRIQVGWKPVGESIPLPVRGEDSGGGLRWLARPVVGADLPLWTAVVAAARSASSLCGAW